VAAHPPLPVYVAAFGTAAVACLASLARLSAIEDAGTRRGLAGLLVTSALWALAHVVFLPVPVEAVRLAAYYAGLVAGFAAVGAWLYFCSAYTGRMVLVNDITRKERYRRQIEAQNERLDQLAGVISHDLRNPPNVASGRLEMVRKQHDDENLSAVANSLGRMRQLIENLLTMTREGLDVRDKRPVSLETLAADAWTMVDTDGADLVVEADTTLRADRDRLRQALENPFRNSVEHGPTSGRTDGVIEDGGSDVTVTVGPLEEGPDFFVADDGPGIPPDKRERVLEFGESGEGGSGLGLAIVDTIARAHGWDLTTDGASDGGARFEFTGVEPADTEEVPDAEAADMAGEWELVGGDTAN
jgi:signal transduction histidine kinase